MPTRWPVSRRRGAEVRLADLSWPEIGQRAAAGAVLAVPVGSTEQHGPHLPLSTDTDIAVALCDRLAAARPDVLAAPPVGYGSSGEHAGFPGTLSIGHGRTGTAPGRAGPVGHADVRPPGAGIRARRERGGGGPGGRPASCGVPAGAAVPAALGRRPACGPPGDVDDAVPGPGPGAHGPGGARRHPPAQRDRAAAAHGRGPRGQRDRHPRRSDRRHRRGRPGPARRAGRRPDPRRHRVAPGASPGGRPPAPPDRRSAARKAAP